MRKRGDGYHDLETIFYPVMGLHDELEVTPSSKFDFSQEGLVVDISSVYNNTVSLKVGDKLIAKGELVIINDRYGVKISNVTADDIMSGAPVSIADVNTSGEELAPQTQSAIQNTEPVPQQATPAGGGDDFDYSDFDIDADDL